MAPGRCDGTVCAMELTVDDSRPASVAVTETGKVCLVVWGPAGETITVAMPPFAAEDLADALCDAARQARNAGDVLAELALTVNGL